MINDEQSLFRCDANSCLFRANGMVQGQNVSKKNLNLEKYFLTIEFIEEKKEYRNLFWIFFVVWRIILHCKCITAENDNYFLTSIQSKASASRISKNLPEVSCAFSYSNKEWKETFSSCWFTFLYFFLVRIIKLRHQIFYRFRRSW